MCVGLSAKVVKISNGTAVIDAGGAKREVSSQLLEDLEPGDYVMVHAGVAEIIENYDGPAVRIMEVCGTHTHEIFRLGIRKLLPKQVELISGPGCPVCVTPVSFID